MDVILLQPDSVVNLTLLALIVPFAVYLLSLRDKDEATWWLFVHLAGSALVLFAYALFTSIFWPTVVGSADPSVSERALVRLPHLFNLVAAWAYVQFAYAVLHDRFPREARLVWAVTAVLVLSVGAVLAYNFLLIERLNFGTVSGTIALYAASVIGTTLYVWALVVFVRKWRLLRRSPEEQDRRAAEAFGFYALLTCGALVSTAFRSGTQIYLPMPEDRWFLEPLLWIGFTFGLAFAYVNYSTRATTFQVKLVGLTLTAVLFVLASAVVITAETAEAELQGEPIPASQAFQFTPDGRGGYDGQAAAIGYDAARGENLGLDGNGARALALPFDFSFGGVTWDTVYAYSDGFVTVGGLIDTTWHKHRYIHRKDVPKIAPLYMNLNPSRGGGVFARVDRDRLVVTWHDVPHGYGWKEYNVSWREQPVRYAAYPTTNRVQLVLHAGGAIDMVYDRVMIPPGVRTYGARGLVMGGSLDESVPAEQDFGAVFREQMFVDFDAQQAFTVPPGTSVLEDLYVKYRRLLHERLRLLAWLVVGATVFIVLVVPHFYRWSLTRPLERLLGGMKRVDSGDLDVAVSVGVRDEIGRLTHHFNRMTDSLRAYAGGLETRVAERTAELQAEKEKTEHQAEALAAQAEQLRELDALKSRFFANVSHELRTPLTLLLGPVKDALDPENERAMERLRAHLPLMERNGERLLALIGQLLDLARLEGGGMHLHARRLDLVVFVGALTDGFMARAEALGLSLVFDPAVHSLPAWADPDKLEKVVVNLLSNALKFTPQGGKIRVRVGRRRDAESRHDGWAEVAVQDTGPGIPPEELPHIFDRFHQVDGTSTRSHEGAGIGLALARELVELHRGTLTVESTAGFGSTFTVRLPLGTEHLGPDEIVEEGAGGPILPTRSRAVPDASAPDKATSSGSNEGRNAENVEPVLQETSPEASSEQTPLVLVVEDNADMRAYLRSLLEPTYRVAEAVDGQEGIGLARSLAAAEKGPALVISDVMMPGTDGFTLCRTLKGDADLQHVPVILLTARADDASRLEGLAEGADAYLAKPFSAEELMTRAENLIALRQRLREHFGGRVVVGPTAVEVPSAEAAWVATARDVVEARLADTTLSVDRLAEELAMSTRQLQRRMKEALDLTPHGFIRMLRLERAAQLLEQGAGGVAEVAYAVGYQTPDYFSRQFREVFGVPPSGYAEEKKR